VASISCVALPSLPAFTAGADLAEEIAAAAPPDLADGDVLVVAHKIVSKAEGRVRRLGDIEPGARARALAVEHRKDPRLVQAVLDESAEIVRAVDGVLICRTR
jgi:coenzyme F420-0:L-glutamate ligase / coenzyme F420-1:gamma-L-glutamate ligase